MAHHPRNRTQQKPTRRNIFLPISAKTNPSVTLAQTANPPQPGFYQFYPHNLFNLSPSATYNSLTALFKGQQHSRQRRRSELMPREPNGIQTRILWLLPLRLECPAALNG
jgi:hypothetical protein